MSKVTMQDIADALGISRVTVWKVLNKQPGVSAERRKIVNDKAEEMGYFKRTEENAMPVQERTVSLIVSRPDSATFWTNIIHRTAQELAMHNINMMYTCLPSSYSSRFEVPSVLSNNAVQGAIVLNVYDRQLVEQVNQLSIPKVFLDTVPQIAPYQLSGDLVLLEGFQTVYQITESILKRGVTRLGFIGDIFYARTNLERYQGFCQCMRDHNLPVREEYNLIHGIGIYSYQQEISQFLDSLRVLPEAFICASDYVAHFLQTYFSEKRERIPEGIIVTGYDGSKEYTNVDNIITTANVRTELLGRRLSMQIIYRMENREAPYELTYIKPSIIYRDSVLQ